MTSCSSPHAHGDNAALIEYCRNLRAQVPQCGKVLFVQIPQVVLGSFNREIALKRGYYAFPPTGLQFLYEAIKHRDLEIRILDLNYELLQRVFDDPNFDHNDWPLILEETLDSFQPDVVGISCLFDPAIGPMLDVLRRVRARGRSVVVAGGVIATYEWKALLAPDLAHFVVQGEGENKLNFLLDCLSDQNLGVAPTPGIYFHPNAETWLQSDGAPDIVSVGGTLIDSYKLVPIERYFKVGSLNPFSRRMDSAPFAPIQMSRGCRAQCTFCAVRDFMGRGVRCRSAEDMLAEMEFLITERGVRHFEWLDDDLLFYHKELKALMQGIIDKGWDIHWSANNGLIAASVDREMMDLIQRSGCIGFKIGIETGNPDMLKKVKKPGTLPKFLKFAEIIKDFPGPFVGGNFIVGLPGETNGQMMDSFRFSMAVDLDWSAFTVCQVIRGASAFSDSGEYFEHQIRTEGKEVRNFIPVREAASGKIEVRQGTARNLAVFQLDADQVPDAEQVKEIWFAFNIIGNYVFNKNLSARGRADKFISWVETAQRAYPTNPYMSLFLSFAYTILGKSDVARALREQTIRHRTGEYWDDRFKAFSLDRLIEADPQTPDEVFAALASLQEILRPAFEATLSARPAVA